MSFEVKKVAVLGSGVMGSQIAAHISNASIEVLAFDIDQETADKGLKAAQEIKPAAFYSKNNSDLITPLNYNDHISRISECDWVIEAISERIEWKKDLYNKVAPHLSDNAVLTSNTSGISLSELSQDMDDNLRQRFFITHFFNPPRYMKLVEIIYPGNIREDLMNVVINIMRPINASV